jgi:hypothetical protein
MKGSTYHDLYMLLDSRSKLPHNLKDVTPPKIVNLSPDTNKKVSESSIIIKGTIDERAKIIINSDNIEISDKNKFEYEMDLETGKNTLKVILIDKAGNKSIKDFIYERVDECYQVSKCGICGNPDCKIKGTETTKPSDPKPDATIQTECDLNYNKELMGYINNYRVQNGLNKVRMDYKLNDAACSHSTCMNSTGNITHNGENGSTPWDRCANAGSYCDGEIITHAWSPYEAFIDWKNSASHNRNMLTSSWKALGAGAAGPYVTVVFRT